MSVLNEDEDDIEDEDEDTIVVVVRMVLDGVTTDRRVVEVGPNTGEEMVVMGVVTTSENASLLHQIDVRPSL